MTCGGPGQGAAWEGVAPRDLFVTQFSVLPGPAPALCRPKSPAGDTSVPLCAGDTLPIGGKPGLCTNV